MPSLFNCSDVNSKLRWVVSLPVLTLTPLKSLEHRGSIPLPWTPLIFESYTLYFSFLSLLSITVKYKTVAIHKSEPQGRAYASLFQDF